MSNFLIKKISIWLSHWILFQGVLGISNQTTKCHRSVLLGTRPYNCFPHEEKESTELFSRFGHSAFKLYTWYGDRLVIIVNSASGTWIMMWAQSSSAIIVKSRFLPSRQNQESQFKALWTVRMSINESQRLRSKMIVRWHKWEGKRYIKDVIFGISLKSLKILLSFLVKSYLLYHCWDWWNIQAAGLCYRKRSLSHKCKNETKVKKKKGIYKNCTEEAGDCSPARWMESSLSRFLICWNDSVPFVSEYN